MGTSCAASSIGSRQRKRAKNARQTERRQTFTGAAVAAVLANTSELHLGGFLGSCLGGEVSLALEFGKQSGDEDRGEAFPTCVECLGGFIEVPALLSDAILRLLE